MRRSIRWDDNSATFAQKRDQSEVRDMSWKEFADFTITPDKISILATGQKKAECRKHSAARA